MPGTSQVVQTTIAPTTQLNFRQMIGEVQQWNPDVSPQMIKRWLNNSYRRVIDKRNWYGLLVKGQVDVPDVVTGGTIALTNGSATVTGTGTAFTADMVGRQIRSGFSTPLHTIKTFTSPTEVTLDLPWGGQTVSANSYQIFQNIVNFGDNVKWVLAVVNQRQGFRLRLNVPQEELNIHDTWRTQTGWTFMAAGYAPSSSGVPQYELYPAPTFAQSFPFLVYIQPPDFVVDADFPYAFIRADVIVTGAIPKALLFRGKNSKYYDPQAAATLESEFQVELEKMERKDNDHYQRDLIWEFGKYQLTSFGADFRQSHDFAVDEF